MEEIIQEYLDMSPIVVNENANHNFAISGLKSHIASTVLKDFTMRQSPASEYHKSGSIHLHDSAGGPWSAYCRGLDLLQILLEGIKNPAGTSSNPARHFDVAVDHIVNAFYVSQNEWEGAQAFSFHPNTPVTIRRNGNIESYPIEDLYNMYDISPIHTNEQDIILPPFKTGYSIDDIRAKHSKLAGMDQKFIFQNDDIEILDGNGFVPINAISRHRNESESDTLIKVQTKSGKVLIVTKSHPMITTAGEKPADSLVVGDELIATSQHINIGGNISIDPDFMWVVGMMIAEGGQYGHQTVISQNDTSRITEKLETLGIKHSVARTKNVNGNVCHNVVVSSTSIGRLIMKFFGLRKYAWNKNLPNIFPNLCVESLFALISGYIDGDGSVASYDDKSSSVRITSTSYTILSQIQSIFAAIGISATVRCAKPISSGQFVSKHDVYVLRCRIDERFSEHFKECDKMQDFRWKVSDRNNYPDVVESISTCLWQPDYVYDVTTLTGTFDVKNADTLLAPFVAADNLTPQQVEQGMQRMVFNLSFPLRSAFQCVSADTEILTDSGWKTHATIELNDLVATFNVDNQHIEYNIIQRLFREEYNGMMYNLKNRITDQMVSPRHRIIHKKFNSDNDWVVNPIEKCCEFKSGVIIPVGSNGVVKDSDMSDEWIQLIAWIIADGTYNTTHDHIILFKSPERYPEYYAQIKDIIDALELDYKMYEYDAVLGNHPIRRFEFTDQSSERIMEFFDGGVPSRTPIKYIPRCIRDLNCGQSMLFIDTYLKADNGGKDKIISVDKQIIDGIANVCVNAGCGSTIRIKQPSGKISKKVQYVLRIIRHMDTYVTDIKQVEYKGVIWCPTTENGTFIARRNGKVFATGNTHPFHKSKL